MSVPLVHIGRVKSAWADPTDALLPDTAPDIATITTTRRGS